MKLTKKKSTALPVTNETVRAAYETLQKYKQGKTNLEMRIIENEEWWKLQHYDNGSQSTITPSPWLFNTIINKHADAMDNIPTVSCLPRERGDEAAAKLLSDVLPVILEENRFEKIYSSCWFDKLKSGTGCYGVFWNNALCSGIGDIDIRRIELLNLFWEPGICDIQRSKNVFHVELWDNEVLLKKYPSLSDSLSTPVFDTARYIYDDTVDTSDKSAVIDWYYKKTIGSKEILHFCKFANGILLYASENDESYMERGFYDHRKYPFILDSMYPVQGSPCGFGVIDAMKSTQSDIDALSSAIVKNARMAAERRYFVRADGSLNEKEFADFTRPFVHYQGSGDPNSSIMPIQTPVLSDIYVGILNNKIDELKETSGNRDFSQGSVTGGVTAAAAIAALQEAGSKTSRDIISASYRSIEEVCSLIISLIGQFYTVPRCFRITGKNGVYEFMLCSSDDISGMNSVTPVFDIKIRAHKKDAFSRASANELACNLYRLGIFDPQHIDRAEACFALMEFEGKDEALAILRSNAKKYEKQGRGVEAE